MIEVLQYAILKLQILISGMIAIVLYFHIKQLQGELK